MAGDFQITLKNLAPGGRVTTNDFARIVQRVQSEFDQVIRAGGGSGSVTIHNHLRGQGKMVAPFEPVVYCVWHLRMRDSIANRETGYDDGMDPSHGGVTTNSPKGVISEVWLNKIGTQVFADLDDITFAIVHEIMHNKIDVGSVQIGRNFLFNGQVINDIHSQGGGAVAGHPQQNYLSDVNKKMLASAMGRIVLQYTRDLR